MPRSTAPTCCEYVTHEPQDQEGSPERRRSRCARGRRKISRGIVACHRAAYPEYPESAYYNERFYEMQFAAFPEGQFLAEADGEIIGYATSLIVQLDDDAHWYTYEEITGGGTFSTHDPSGDTLYGADIGVRPEWRRHGVSTTALRESVWA